jgi:oxidase EvaA
MDCKNLCRGLLDSWRDKKGIVNKTDGLLRWIQEENDKTRAVLNECKLSDSTYWFYDSQKSVITNKNQSFFTLNGVRGSLNDGRCFEQPIIIQNEVGYLGIITKEIDGEIQCLMQAKIEPGNVNNVQISPTIQATESNFTQKHGGKRPNYLDYFSDVSRFQVIYDGKEPEQCGRFLGKFNRNVAIFVDGDVEVLSNFRWMSIGQIKFLATHYPNLVNMDTRTVLSCLPYELGSMTESAGSGERTLFTEDDSDSLFAGLLSFRRRAKHRYDLIRLDQLDEWIIDDFGMRCRQVYPFEVRYFDIDIKGREVTHWSQPLVVARGMALFGLFVVDCGNIFRFLIHIKEEVGCFDVANFGPTIQMESNEINKSKKDSVEELFFSHLEAKKNVLVDTILSEEGGRFYHEENRNILLYILQEDLPADLPGGYYLASYRTVRQLIAKYHCANIQLRDLMSLYGGNL